MGMGIEAEEHMSEAADGDPPVAAAHHDAVAQDDIWEDGPDAAGPSLLMPGLLTLLGAAWIAFFAVAHGAELARGVDLAQAGDLLVSLSVPLILIGLVWLLAMRTSHRESRRFADVSQAMHRAGDTLHTRMAAVNNEISMAREFLEAQTREIDMLGRTRARDIRESAEAIEQALTESTRKAEVLDEVSRAASGNLERLRAHLPVVTSSAKDVTNQIAAAGAAAGEHGEAMALRATDVQNASEDLSGIIDLLASRAGQAADLIADRGAQTEQRLTDFLQQADDRSVALADAMRASVADMLSSLDDSAERQRHLAIATADNLRAQLEKLDIAMAEVGARGSEQGDRITRLARDIDESAVQASERIDHLDKVGGDATARIAFALSAALDNSRDLAGAIAGNDQSIDGLAEHTARLDALLESISARTAQDILPGLDRTRTYIEETAGHSDRLATGLDAIERRSAVLREETEGFGAMIERQAALIDRLVADSGTAFAERAQDGAALERALMEARDALQRLGEDVAARLGAAVDQVRDRANEAAEHARTALAGVVDQSADQLSVRTAETLAQAVNAQLDEGAERWDSLVRQALKRTDETTALLEQRLSKLDQMVANLENRLDRAHESFEGTDDDAFARRMLLLTESLNSTSIDVAKILSNDVTDTAWAAYLKGDRGVFTRRAVRLLETSEVRVVAQHYEDETEFRGQVNRYIHDFETIMRNLMSTRDGSAIAVTLLSSDVGKLYVALAQAIERLRT